MKLKFRFVLFSGWLMFRDHLRFAPGGYHELGTRYGLKVLSRLGYKMEASK